MLRLNRKLALFAFVVTVISFGLYLKTDAVSNGADWRAGNIISDLQFFKSDSMSVSDIQNFLNSQVPECDSSGSKMYNSTQTRAQYGAANGYPAPYTCLKDYVENPTTHENNSSGGSVSGGWTSAQIIKYASDTYNINPKVLIVLLQKEQSLVTDTWPWSSQYRSATGYGCPDTAPCDSEYYGFYNQVTSAAAQYQRYANNPGNYRYKAYQTNYIQYNPSVSCGGTNVYIENQATAGLYNYTPYQPNASSLSNLYGSGDSCGAYGNRNFWRFYSDWFGSTQYEPTLITYKSHLSYLGWTDSKTNSGMTGTVGQSRPMEAFKINGEVEYSSYNDSFGWQPTVNRGMISGTTGLGRHINAVKISPLGDLANKYDIYYRVQVSYVGWMGWAKNGEVAGVSGDSSRDIEAIELFVAPKGFSAPGSTTNVYQNFGQSSYSPAVSVNVSSHVSSIGWQPYVTDDMASGTTEMSKAIEGLKINLSNSTGLAGSIYYSSHLAGVGWQDFVSDDQLSGTTGQHRDMQAVRILLTGSLGDTYDIYYRTYVQYIGWMGWTKNGEAAGSVGASRRLEAIDLKILPKDSPISTNQPQYLYNPTNQPIPPKNSINYSAHVSFLGWQNSVGDNMIAGTTGQSKTIEAIKFTGSSSIFGSLGINCSVFSHNAAWVNDISEGGLCGTTGQSKSLDAIKLTLAGSAASKYDIYYKVHLSYLGWQDWVKNGEQAGYTQGNNPIEAVIVKLVKK